MTEAAGSNRFKGIIGLNREPTVSCDFNHDPHSSTFDLTQTVVMGKRLVRILSWYDNEWGFSNRMGDAAVALCRRRMTGPHPASASLRPLTRTRHRPRTHP